MTTRDVMKNVAAVRNALYGMAVCGEQTHIVSDCVRTLDALLNELNQDSANTEAEHFE